MLLVAFIAGLLGTATCVNAIALMTRPPALPTPRLALARDGIASLSTCGYLSGDPSQPWVAPKGFNCRVDTQHGIWGFCPTTVIAATDCGLGAFCFDAGPCSTGCGRDSLRNNPKVTTWTCPEADDAPDAKFCSTGTLIFGPDQTYDYVDCARGPGKATYFVSPTAALSTTLTSSSTSRPSSSSPPDSSSQPTPKSTSGTLSATATSRSLLSSATTESTTATGAAAKGEGGSSNNNTAAIVGGVIGGLALVLGSVVALVYILRHNCTRRPTNSKEEQGKVEQDVPSTLDAEQKYYPTAGWGPGELAAEGPHGTAELPAYRFSRAPVVPPAELPAYGR